MKNIKASGEGDVKIETENITTYTNDKGEVVLIKEMESGRLIHAIAKYAALNGKEDGLVKALKSEAIGRLLEDTKKETF